jgi:hypothetical protein
VTLAGSIRHYECQPWEMPQEASCLLDIADAGPVKLLEVARILGVTKQWVSMVQRDGMRKVGERL